jgi:hypothetical protein
MIVLNYLLLSDCGQSVPVIDPPLTLHAVARLSLDGGLQQVYAPTARAWFYR